MPGTNPESHTGSLPHCVTYFLYGAPAGVVSGSAENPCGGSATPSISPYPDAFHPRSRYTRNPPPRRQLESTPRSSMSRVQPKIGTTYSTCGTGGGAALGIHVTCRAPVTLMCSSVGTRRPPSVVV